MRHQFLRAAATLRNAILATATTETLDYIARGEGVNGDNQQLEDGVLAAMVSFANWRIPLGGACCLMTGWRTLEGALTPMVGPAPTGVNLVAGDYDRLRVALDGATKYFETNRLQNADPQDDHHRYVHLASEWTFGAQKYLLFAGNASSAATGRLNVRSAANGLSLVWASNCAWFIQSAATAPAGGIAVGRNTTTDMKTYRGGVEATIGSRSSVEPEAEPILIGGRAGFDHADAQINGYSLGAWIDPADLDTRMTAAVNAIDRALNPLRYAILDQLSVDTLEYLFAVEAADDERLENDVLAAMGSFAEWRIPLGGACCLMAGPRTLAGALTPMVGPTPTAVNFITDDYNRSRLLGSGTAYINTNLSSTGTQDNVHGFVFARAGNFADASGGTFGNGLGSVGAFHCFGTGTRGQNATSNAQTSLAGDTGFMGIARGNSEEYTRLRLDGALETITIASQAPRADNFGVYIRINDGAPAGSPAADSLGIYSFGPNLSLTEARTRCQSFSDALTTTGL